jgi:hypothetical protein
MSPKFLVACMLAALAQTGILQPAVGANIAYSNTTAHSQQASIEVRITAWIDGYLEDVGGDKSFSKRLRDHLAGLMLQEDSVTFLKNLVDRGALRQSTPIESYFEEYVHFITWQSSRRLPDTLVPQYLDVMSNLSQIADEPLCRDLLNNRSTIGLVLPREQFRLISELPKVQQDRYFYLIGLGFRRLTSGAYPLTRLSGRDITDLQESYLAFQPQPKGPAENCGRFKVFVSWTRAAKTQENLRSYLWLSGQLLGDKR